MFPDFNKYSIPLLILVLQGLVFACLLLIRYQRKKNNSDLFLGLILLISCYGQICYTVGFMGWYDTYRHTKINYFLFNTSIAVGPLIYLYVKSITQSNFCFRPYHLWHFVPSLVVILFRTYIFIYDFLQPGFHNTQNGYLKINADEAWFQPVTAFILFPVMLLYLAFTFQLFYNYRKRIIQYFSNTYKLQLNWILSFLLLYCAMFIYDSVQTFIGANFMDLGYRQRWWLNFLAALITLYVGIRGYFTDTTQLNKLSFRFSPSTEAIPQNETVNSSLFISSKLKDRVLYLMEHDKIYLNPELNLLEMADMAKMTRGQLSEVINNGFNQNFNDFINSYRIEAFKTMLSKNRHEQLSLLGIAQECGFNSKATFNRVFKKLTDDSPSGYLRKLTN